MFMFGVRGRGLWLDDCAPPTPPTHTHPHPPPSKTDAMALDSIVLSVARKLLGERACKKTRLSQPVTSDGVGLP